MLDTEKQTMLASRLKTFAKKIGTNCKNAVVRLIKTPRAWAVSIAVVLLVAVVGFIIAGTKMVYVHDGDTARVVFTMEKDPHQILQGMGVTTSEDDSVLYTAHSGNIATILIDRAFPVTVMVDGQEHILSTTPEKVGKVLDEIGVTLGESDVVSHSLESYVSPNLTVSIRRVGFHQRSETESIAYGVTYKPTSLLAAGNSRHIISDGVNGERSITYEDRYIDGQLDRTEEIFNGISIEPVNQVRLLGSPGTPVSNLNYGVAIEGNKPVSYKKVFTGVKATGYTARPGAWGASGKTLSLGSVAVDPSIIPYGTKMYITSPDGKFVYGFAIAADTGGFVHNDGMQVDLYYDTYLESCLNGARNVNIYILD